MNTNKLQSFAAEARTSLMKAVRARIDAALEPNSLAQSDSPRAYRELVDEIRRNGGGEQGRAKTAERHAYRWFNRIIALRYMDANEFTGVHVVSGEELDNPNALPAVLSAAKRGEFEDEVFGGVGAKSKVLPTIQALLDGDKPSNDPQGDAYGLLLRSYCDYWYKFLPFMFDDAGAADEILMPADLLAKDSVLRKAVEVMSVADCVGESGEGNVEIIGWLYQFYIAERKDEVMAGFKKSKKAGADEIPAATQLFTPDWIVRYLVQNTVGRLWTQNHPESQLHNTWEYYIDPVGEDAGEILKIDSPEDLTVCDPACGSGHMLTYAFDLLYSIYDEAGYSANEIPGLILEHNLFGMEIDERAANLAAFALTMKARGKYRRFFRKGRQVQPNIQRITPEYFTDDEVAELNDLYGVTLDADTWNTYQNADTYGSLIQPPTELAALASVPSDEGAVERSETGEENTLFDEGLTKRANLVLAQTRYLSRQYAAVVANPPYMGSGNMGNDLKKFVNDHYKDGKADLFAAFMLRNLQLIQPNALLGMITMQSWMFLSSFESLRKSLLANNAIETMAHLGSGAFDSIGGEVVSTTAFTIRRHQASEKGIYLRLVDVQGDDNQAQTCSKILGSLLRDELSSEQTERSVGTLLFTIDQRIFSEIPGHIFAYWTKQALVQILAEGTVLEKIAPVRQGFQTGDNERFLRYWYEVSKSEVIFDASDLVCFRDSEAKYAPYVKGGSYRKWFGNEELVSAFDKESYKDLLVMGNHLPSRDFYFKQGLTWSAIGSSFGARYNRVGRLFSGKGAACFSDDNIELLFILGLLNSTVVAELLSFMSATLDYNVGSLKTIPLVYKSYEEVIDSVFDENNVNAMLYYSCNDWNSYETSWDFTDLKVLDFVTSDCLHPVSLNEFSGANVSLDDVISAYITHCKYSAEEQCQREIENNKQVADVYGVRNEVPCDVPIERVSLKRNPAFVYPKNTPAERDELMTRDIVKEIISYAVGCMFGRYSLDKSGLILASQGETLADYHAQIPDPSFEPDSDNVIPVTEDEWFEDDIVARFRQFLSVALGEQHLEENVAYIEQVLGKSLRKYFVNDFYDDHVKMYKNRPIYWMYSSRTDKKGAFKALVYLHRYTPATTNNVLAYLRDFTAKLHAQAERLAQSDKASEVRQSEKLQTAIKECADYERDILYPLATRNLPIDLDDGVLVNYLRMGKALRTIPAIEKKRTTVQSWTWPVNPLGEQ